MVEEKEMVKESIELLKKRIDRATQQSKKMQEKLQRFSCNYLDFEEITSNSIQELCSNFSLLDIKNEMDAIYDTYYLVDNLQTQLKKSFSKLEDERKISVKTTSFLPENNTRKLKIYNENDATFSKKEGEKPEKIYGNRIEICLESDFFIVKTPHLLSVNNKKQTNIHERFADILSKEIKEKLKEHRVFLTQFAPKHITVLQNHHCQEWNIADNNNLDTKKIVDGICEFCNGDSALTTSFLLAASRNLLIQDACYFIVTKGYCNVKTVEEYLLILMKKFPKNKGI